MTYKSSAYLDGGHDLVKVELVIRARDTVEAIDTFNKAMQQLGFKRSDYGYVFTAEIKEEAA